MIRSEIPQSIADFIFADPLSGDLFWKKKASCKTVVGSKAGSLRPDGYEQIGFMGRYYMSHRVLWFLATGEQPGECIDHINGDKTDNRLKNLRNCVTKQNRRNHTKNYTTNKSGVNGVYWNKNAQKWYCRIKKNGKYIWLGSYDCLGVARSVRISEEKAHYEKFSRYWEESGQEATRRAEMRM